MVGRWEGRSLVLGLIVRELALAERISETAPELFARIGALHLAKPNHFEGWAGGAGAGFAGCTGGF